MPMPPRFLSALLACLLASCATSPSTSSSNSDIASAARPAATHAPDSLLLVSLDGFRADYLDLGITPNLSRIARQGVRARWMTPSYPTLTFPNHYSMVTGLVPDHHGIVHNTMRDAALGGFKLSDREAVGDGRWWGGEPIWVSAERAGLPSATLYWPGSEAEIAGVRPTRWRQYREGHTLPLAARVDTVLGWLSEPQATRPRIATLYFETVDHDSHAYGPDSPQAHAAVRAVDAALGRLLDGLVARGIAEHVNLVVVSDHGMAAVPRSQLAAVEDVVSKEEATVVTIGQVITIAPNPGYEARVERKLLGKHDGYECWRKGGLPALWRYGSHARVPPLVCQMDEGWDMLPSETIAKRTAMTRGSHGYDPALPSMRALFVASGPAFRRGVTLQPFANVDVYPLLARLLGIRPAPHDGDIAPLLPALRDAPGSM
jgi:predicted AlkP superfamily pyrophosphatase or phosphodiesterase